MEPASIGKIDISVPQAERRFDKNRCKWVPEFYGAYQLNYYFRFTMTIETGGESFQRLINF